MKKIFSYFSTFEIFLWCFSVLVITISFFMFNSDGYLTLIASLTGVTSLIFNAKGNPFGQLLMIIFSVFYGIISYGFSYYGEMITYLGMTAPMAGAALVSWLKNPFKGKKSEVKVNTISKKELGFMSFLTVVVTVIFYFILKAFDTSNLILSIISVTTSFAAVYLTARRSPLFAVFYAANDVVLIALWSIASIYDISYLSVIICFVVFLINDIYGFWNWRKIQQKQREDIKI